MLEVQFGSLTIQPYLPPGAKSFAGKILRLSALNSKILAVLFALIE
jgi:hypothetical protein